MDHSRFANYIPSGNVGIGTQTPSTTLDVQGKITSRDGLTSKTGTYTAGGTYTNQWQKVCSFEYSNQFYYGGVKLNIAIVGDTSGATMSANVTIGVKFQNNNGRLHVNITDNTGSMKLLADDIEVLRDATTSTTGVITVYYRPTRNYSRPHYTALSNYGLALTWYGSVVGANLSGETSDAFTEYNKSDAIFQEADTGRVGIGTDAPSRKLSVIKNTTITGGFNDISEFLDTTIGVGGSVSLNVGRANSNKNLGKMAFKYAGSGSNSNAINWGFYDADNLMTLLASGNVGIGGTPSHKLHIKQNSAANLINLIEQDNASYEAWYEAKSQNSGYARFGISDDANAYAFFNTSVTSYNWYHTGGGLLMTLNSNGHLGLGITNLTFAKLAVNGATYSSGGTFNAGTDTVTNAAFVLDEGDYIYTRDSSAYARKLIGKNTSDIIQIGQASTSLIDGMVFYSGNNADYKWYRNTSVAMQLYGSGSQPYEILDVKGRIKAETDNGSTVNVPRSKSISYQGSSGYYDFDPVAEFGHSKQGGYVLLEVNGWQTRFNAGYIHWHNNGGTGAIGTGSVTYRQIAWSGSASGAGVTVSTVSSSTNVIRISFSGWHGNAHGWRAAIINRW